LALNSCLFFRTSNSDSLFDVFWLYSHYESNSVSGAWYKVIYGDIPFKFFAGLLVILSLQYFTPYFYYIPKASLAAVIIAAVVFMVEFHVVKPMWRTKSKSFCSFLYCSSGVILNVSHTHYRCCSCKLPVKTIFMYFMCAHKGGNEQNFKRYFKEKRFLTNWN